MPVKYAPYIDDSLQAWVSSNYPDGFNHVIYDYSLPYDIRAQSKQVIPGEWRLIEDFKDTMIYEGWDKGRSAVRIFLRDSQGHKQPLFMMDFDDIIRYGYAESIGGKTVITGTWRVVKRGANYGLRHLEAFAASEADDQ